jgi:hypothetical protein
LIDTIRPSLAKPTLSTRFHIDYDWWEKNERDWRVYLKSYLCPEHQEKYADHNENEAVDWVDPDTAEVQQVDGIQHILISHCAKQAGFITDRTALVDAVFRLFLANGNTPLTSQELSEKLGKPADTILRVMAGMRVYKGLRPILK